MAAITLGTDPAVPAVRRVMRSAARCVFRSYTTDVVARRIADRPPDQLKDTGVVLHRLRSLADAAVMTPSLLHGQFDDLPLHLPVLNPLRRARWRREVVNRFRRGDVAYVATVDGDIAGWIWMSHDRVIRDSRTGLCIHLEPGDAYVYHFWAVPRHRHRGSARLLMGGALWDLHRALADARPRPDGSDPRVFGMIDRPNPANLFLTTLIFGFGVVQTVRRVRILVCLALQVPWSADPPGGPCSCAGARAIRHGAQCPS
jgi:GNAT superfamily N-acetyltransferase